MSYNIHAGIKNYRAMRSRVLARVEASESTLERDALKERAKRLQRKIDHLIGTLTGDDRAVYDPPTPPKKTKTTKKKGGK